MGTYYDSPEGWADLSAHRGLRPHEVNDLIDDYGTARQHIENHRVKGWMLFPRKGDPLFTSRTDAEEVQAQAEDMASLSGEVVCIPVYKADASFIVECRKQWSMVGLDKYTGREG